MPTYEYECKSCGHNFEAFQAISDDPLKICPECGKDIRRLIFGGAGVIFKGSGFYVTDKNKSSSITAGKKSKPETTSDSADSGSQKSPAASADSTEQKKPAGEKAAPVSKTA